MATHDVCSVSTGCGESWVIGNQRMPLRFKIKNTEGDFGSVTGVVVHLRRQVPHTIDFGAADGATAE
jgi:hypothetical protein